MIRYLLTILAVGGLLEMKAQDFHLSQYNNAPLYMNPAVAGQTLMKRAQYRISSLHRSQWGNVSQKAFSTAYLGFDVKLDDRWGMGLNVINNQAGSSVFRTLNIMWSGSYNIMNDRSREHVLTTGVQLGLMHKSFRLDNATFDAQYDGSTGTFDQSLDHLENLNSESIIRLDAGWGMYYRYKPRGTGYSVNGALAISHLAFPNESFEDTRALTPLHWKVNAGGEWKAAKGISIDPSLLFMYQKGATELNISTQGSVRLKNPDYHVLGLLGYRLKDAAIVGVGMKYREINGMVSYDFNTSYLSNYTNRRGGYEISLVYQGLK